MRTALLALPLAAACIAPVQGTTHVPVLDPIAFRDEVAPILEERCSNPTCHGRDDRPFALYATGRHRVDPARTFLDEPLTPEESVANYVGACGFTIGVGVPEDCLLLGKPLAVAAGGAGHLGGDVWIDDRDPEYLTVLAWVRTAEPGP